VKRLTPTQTLEVEFGDRTAQFSACVILPPQVRDKRAIHYWLWAYGHGGDWSAECPTPEAGTAASSALVHKLSFSIPTVRDEREVKLDAETRLLLEAVLARLTPVLFDR
jgi:hypothetical protein